MDWINTFFWNESLLNGALPTYFFIENQKKVLIRDYLTNQEKKPSLPCVHMSESDLGPEKEDLVLKNS